ncbi:unnamed protein product, partial [Choristocarpus tenellus]
GDDVWEQGEREALLDRVEAGERRAEEEMAIAARLTEEIRILKGKLEWNERVQEVQRAREIQMVQEMERARQIQRTQEIQRAQEIPPA